jgi:hypothetical protein
MSKQLDYVSHRLRNTARILSCTVRANVTRATRNCDLEFDEACALIQLCASEEDKAKYGDDVRKSNVIGSGHRQAAKHDEDLPRSAYVRLGVSGVAHTPAAVTK